MTANRLAELLRVPRTRIERLVREEQPVTPDTALRLARYFETTAEYWLGLHARFDLECAALAAELPEIVPLADEEAA